MEVFAILGFPINHKRISRLMRKYNIVTKNRRMNPYRKLSRATYEHRVVPNRLNHELPSRATREDIRDRYHLPPHRLWRELLSVLCEGCRHTRDRGKPIVHGSSHGPRLSDDEKARRASPRESTSRGDDSFGPRLPLHPSGLPATRWLVQSMSRRGNCLYNAPIESFFGHLKDYVTNRL